MREKNIDVGDHITVKVGVEIKKVQVTRIGVAAHGNDGFTWHMLTVALDGENGFVPVRADELRQNA